MFTEVRKTSPPRNVMDNVFDSITHLQSLYVLRGHPEISEKIFAEIVEPNFSQSFENVDFFVYVVKPLFFQKKKKKWQAFMQHMSTPNLSSPSANWFWTCMVSTLSPWISTWRSILRWMKRFSVSSLQLEAFWGTSFSIKARQKISWTTSPGLRLTRGNQGMSLNDEWAELQGAAMSQKNQWGCSWKVVLSAVGLPVQQTYVQYLRQLHHDPFSP